MSDDPKVSDKPLPPSSGGPLKKRVVKPNEAIHKGDDPDRYHPFRVRLLVQDSELLPDHLRPVVYYIRGPKKRPDLACQMADQLWQKWEKFEQNIVTEFPDTRGHGYAEVIDENDFEHAWKEVRKYHLKARMAGDMSDPMAFTCLGRTDI